MVGLGAIFVCMLGLFWVVFQHLQQMHAAHLVDITWREKVRITAIMRDSVHMRTFMLPYVASLPDYFDRESERDRFSGYAAKFASAREELVALGLTPEETAFLEDASGQIIVMRPFVSAAIELAIEEPDNPRLLDIMAKARQSQLELLATFEEFAAYFDATAQEQAEFSAHDMDWTRDRAILFATGLILSALVIGSLVLRRETQATKALQSEIAERRHAEETVRQLNRTLEDRIRERTHELAQSESRLIAAQRMARLGNWEWEVGSGTLWWSDETYRLFDLEPGTITPSYETFLEYVHPQDRERVTAAVTATLEDDTPYAIELRIRRADGGWRPCVTHGEVTRSETGTPLVLAGTVLDVSELKQAQDDLQRAKEIAEIASRAKSDFLANMSHELRTPLNAIIGFSDAMATELFGPLGTEKYREYVASIHDSGNHLLDLINDILDVAKIEAGAMEMEEEELDPAQIAEASLRLVRPRAESGRVRLSNGVEENLPRFRGDRRRVKQILLNLLSNAVKFTPEGGRVSLDVRLNGEGLAFLVTDTGIGMDDDELAVALSPFGQIDTGLDRKFEGTGLGLTLTRDLVEAHDGTLEVASSKGEGTVVTVRFPLERLCS